MAGFENDVAFAKNADFTQADNQTVQESNGLATNGQLWIGTTALNAGGTHINVGAITSTTLSVGYSSPNIIINSPGGVATTNFDVQANTAPGTDPVIPTAGGLVTVNGAAVANHSVVLETRSRAANAYNVEVQYGTSAAATDATKSGVAHFNAAQFSVDANGFVSATGSVPIQFTGDSGTATPAAGNINILGLSGSKTSGSGSTLTVKSPPFSQVGASATSSLNTGEFVTAAVTRTLPASAGLADGDLFIYVCTTASALIIQSVGTQKIRMGTLLSSAAGTATSTQIGDNISLRFNATEGFFHAVSWVGTWLIA